MQRRFNARDVEVHNRIQNPVDTKIVDELVKKFPDFKHTYYEDGLVDRGIRLVCADRADAASVHRGMCRT